MPKKTTPDTENVYESKEFLAQLTERDYYCYEDILKKVMEFTPQSVLEIGCGIGNFAKLLHVSGVRTIFALDNSDTFLDYASKDITAKGIKFQKININEYQAVGKVMKVNLFEVVTSVDSVQNIKNNPELFGTIVNSLPKGGKIIFQCPHLYGNVFGTNYDATLFTVLAKFTQAIKGWVAYQILKITNIFRSEKKNVKELIDGVNYQLKKKLDYKVSSKEKPVVLLSSYWFLLFFQNHRMRVRYFNTFICKTKFWGCFFSIFRVIPFLRHLGGRIIFVAEKK